MQFSIDRYIGSVAALRTDDLNLVAAFGQQSLAEPVLRCLRYMHDIEMHTVCYLRDLLVTSAHRDPEITSFLTMWSYEEFWHGAAIAEVLRAHGEPAGNARVRPMRRAHRVKESLKPLIHGTVSAIAGPDLTAVHMTWGAVNEWSTQAGYGLLARKAQHPVLSELLRRIMRQEGRHIDYYASQAKLRLERSARARRMTRTALTKFWAPVGSDVAPATESGHLIRYLFGDDEGMEAAARIDRRVDALPGLDGLHLVTGAVLERTSPLAA
jgi:hypothetical protein